MRTVTLRLQHDTTRTVFNHIGVLFVKNYNDSDYDWLNVLRLLHIWCYNSNNLQDAALYDVAILVDNWAIDAYRGNDFSATVNSSTGELFIKVEEFARITFCYTKNKEGDSRRFVESPVQMTITILDEQSQARSFVGILSQVMYSTSYTPATPIIVDGQEISIGLAVAKLLLQESGYGEYAMLINDLHLDQLKTLPK